MDTPPPVQELEALRQQVTELRALVAELQAEGAVLRGALGRSSAAEEPAGSSAVAGRKAPPRWVKAKVVMVEQHKPRRPRLPVPGRRRQEPDRQVLHAPEWCGGCSNLLSRGEVVQRLCLRCLPPGDRRGVDHPL